MASKPATVKDVRAWARENAELVAEQLDGYVVTSRGRLPAKLLTMYRKATKRKIVGNGLPE